jgi:hypothetical protein
MIETYLQFRKRRRARCPALAALAHYQSCPTPEPKRTTHKRQGVREWRSRAFSGLGFDPARPTVEDRTITKSTARRVPKLVYDGPARGSLVAQFSRLNRFSFRARHRFIGIASRSPSDTGPAYRTQVVGTNRCRGPQSDETSLGYSLPSAVLGQFAARRLSNTARGTSGRYDGRKQGRESSVCMEGCDTGHLTAER